MHALLHRERESIRRRMMLSEMLLHPTDYTALTLTPIHGSPRRFSICPNSTTSTEHITDSPFEGERAGGRPDAALWAGLLIDLLLYSPLSTCLLQRRTRAQTHAHVTNYPTSGRPEAQKFPTHTVDLYKCMCREMESGEEEWRGFVVWCVHLRRRRRRHRSEGSHIVRHDLYWCVQIVCLDCACCARRA